jgi:sugar phosphate isomerase/epimerase
MKLGVSSFAFGWACGVPGSEPSHIMDENDLLDFAQTHDLRLVQMGNNDRCPCRVLRDVIEAVGSERVGVCLDTANSLGAGEGIQEVAEVLAPYTVNLHIKDFTIERLPYLMGFTVSGRPAGDGMLDVPELLQQLQPHGRCRSAILELWTPPEENIEDTVRKEATWASASLQYLKQFKWNF